MMTVFNSFTYYLIIDFAHNSKTKNDRTAKSKALPISGNPEELFFRIKDGNHLKFQDDRYSKTS